MDSVQALLYEGEDDLLCVCVGGKGEDLPVCVGDEGLRETTSVCRNKR